MSGGKTFWALEESPRLVCVCVCVCETKVSFGVDSVARVGPCSHRKFVAACCRTRQGESCDRFFFSLRNFVSSSGRVSVTLQAA